MKPRQYWTSRVSLVESTTKKNLLNRLKQKSKNGQKEKECQEGKGSPLVCPRWPKSCQKTLCPNWKTQGKAPRTWRKKSLCPIRQTQRTPKGRIRKKSEDTEGHLRKLEDISPISIRMPKRKVTKEPVTYPASCVYAICMTQICLGYICLTVHICKCARVTSWRYAAQFLVVSNHIL